MDAKYNRLADSVIFRVSIISTLFGAWLASFLGLMRAATL